MICFLLAVNHLWMIFWIIYTVAKIRKIQVLVVAMDQDAETEKIKQLFRNKHAICEEKKNSIISTNRRRRRRRWRKKKTQRGARNVSPFNSHLKEYYNSSRWCCIQILMNTESNFHLDENKRIFFSFHMMCFNFNFSCFSFQKIKEKKNNWICLHSALPIDVAPSTYSNYLHWQWTVMITIRTFFHSNVNNYVIFDFDDAFFKIFSVS